MTKDSTAFTSTRHAADLPPGVSKTALKPWCLTAKQRGAALNNLDVLSCHSMKGMGVFEHTATRTPTLHTHNLKGLAPSAPLPDPQPDMGSSQGRKSEGLTCAVLPKAFCSFPKLNVHHPCGNHVQLTKIRWEFMLKGTCLMEGSNE